MQADYSITRYCKIRDHRIIRNGAGPVEFDKTHDFHNFMKSVYEKEALSYPKFFKMDALSKLAFITSEILLKNYDLAAYEKDSVGIVMANSNSTHDTDTNYYATVSDKANYFPSPAQFVYTLPNIMVGEICIRNHFQGENAFFVMRHFNHPFICSYVTELLDTQKIKYCITGWTDVTAGAFESMLFLVEKNKIGTQGLEYNAINTQKIYLA